MEGTYKQHPLYKRRSGVVFVFWTVRLVGLAHLAF
jgi:hypothetical protein